MLKRDFRLKKNKDYKITYNKGKYLTGQYVIMYYLKNGLSVNKFGFSISKKVGKAVVRNKIKRRLRECCRLNNSRLAQGYNIIFVARSKIKGIKYVLVEEEIINLLSKANLLKQNS
ncbi:ribonuclease P protein component [Bacillota bacterium LX-D]|nr:ribonuclease P protein component [Bacillota bacterium LX-D]